MKVLPLLALFILLSLPAAAEEAGAATNTISQLMMAGQSVACDFTKDDATGSQTGTFYVGQNKMRGDFNVTDATSGTFTMHMINDGEWSYNWGGPMGEKQGMKMKPSAGRGPGSPGPGLDEPMQMQCRPWPVDASQFVVPSDVQFIEMGGGMLGMAQMQCSACDEMPEGEERLQCQQALGCA